MTQKTRSAEAYGSRVMIKIDQPLERKNARRDIHFPHHLPVPTFSAAI